MTKFNKLSLPTAVLIAITVLGGFLFASEVIKQKSIEKQQENKLIQEQEERCRKDATQQKVNMEVNNPNMSFYSFEYHYNFNTKMCILAYIENRSFWDKGNDYAVIDLFTNEEIYKETIKDGGVFKRGEVKQELNKIANLYFYQKEKRVP